MLILAFLVLAAALAVTFLHHLFDLLGGILERVETEDPGELYVGKPIHQRATRPGARSLEAPSPRFRVAPHHRTLRPANGRENTRNLEDGSRQRSAVSGQPRDRAAEST